MTDPASRMLALDEVINRTVEDLKVAAIACARACKRTGHHKKLGSPASTALRSFFINSTVLQTNMAFCTASCPNDHEQTLSAATIIRFDSSGRLRAYSWLHGRRWQPRQVAEPQSIMHPTRCLQDLLRTASTYRKQHLMNISCSQVVFS